MKTSLFFRILLIMLLFAGPAAFSQVLNGQYNIEAQFVQGYFPYPQNNVSTRKTWISRIALDNNNQSTQLFNYSIDATNLPNNCYSEYLTSNVWGPIRYGSMGVVKNSSSNLFDMEIRSWEDISNNPTDYCIQNSNDGVATSQLVLGNISGQAISQWVDQSLTNVRYRTIWSYANGKNPATALDFTNIGNVETASRTVSHINSNRGAPSDANSDLGYTNFWHSANNFQNSNDVTYKFNITDAPFTVFISTNYNETNFDTYIHLIRREADGSATYITGNDDIGTEPGTKSFIRDVVLCPGNYEIVVEGKGAATGNFKLEVWTQKYINGPNPGEIRIGSIDGPTSATLCPYTNFPDIYNKTPASSPLGSVSYSWEKFEYYNGIGSGWTPISGNSATSSSTYTGQIKTNTSYATAVSIRRVAKSCGQYSTAANSNIVSFTAYTPTVTSAGSIAAQFQMVPFPQEQTNIINNTATPTTYPTNPTFSWYKNDGSGYTLIPGSSSDTLHITGSGISQNTSYKRRVTACNVTGETAPVTVNVVIPNGTIQGKVTDRNGGNGIDGITITARRTSSAPGGIVNKEYTSITANGGLYNIPSIYFGDNSLTSSASATFSVTPSKAGHNFDKATENITLSRAAPVFSNLNFKDTTGFVIAGTVTQECSFCDGATALNPKIFPLDGVQMLESSIVNNSTNLTYQGNSTAIDGKYATIRLYEGNYTLKPQYQTHQFSPVQRTASVGGVNGVLINNIDFRDTTTHVISGNVIINCTDYYIGTANITFSQVLPNDAGGNPEAPKFIKTITTNTGSGTYSVRLPAAKYRVTVNSISNVPSGKDLNAGEIVNFLNAYPDSIRVRDITNSNATLNLYFHEAPRITVTGLDGPCGTGTVAGTSGNNLSSHPLFIQSKPRTFTVKVWEGNPTKACPAKDSMLTISTNIQIDDANEQIDSMTVNGQKAITLVGGIPNIISPFYKTLAINFTDKWNRVANNIVLQPVVTGISADAGTFTTVSPEIPLMILRDPPGDLSSSFWQQNNTVETANSFSAANSIGDEAWEKVKIGTEFEAGLGVTTESKFWGEIGGSISTTGKTLNAEEVILSTTSGQSYSTGTTYLTGSPSDLYIGAAMNLKYARAHEVIYSPDSCSLYRKTRLIIAPNGFATTYAYSEYHILNSIIPDLEDLKASESTQPEIDEKQNQINVWQQIIENNKKQKRESKFVKNVSFDGNNGPITSNVTSSSTKTNTVEFQIELDAALSLELGFEVAGSGVTGGRNINFKMETGGSKTNTTTASTTIGYVLDDNNIGDYFSVDIKADPVYSTPVFDIVAGTSSCPHETGTQARDKFSITAANPILSGIPQGQTGLFPIQIGNLSESQEARVYWLRQIIASSNGALVTNSGSPNFPFQYSIPYLQSQQATIGVQQFDPNKFGFEDIRLQVIDGCDGDNTIYPDQSKEVSISAFFANGCSNITMALPEDGYLVNKSSNNIIPFKMTDYNYANLSNVVIEYAALDSSTWHTAATLSKAQIQNNVNGTTFNLNVSNLEDGIYKFRLKLSCGTSVVLSQRAQVTIDRKSPVLFGNPQPSDGVYSLGDEISMTFNEKMGCSNINQSNFNLIRMSNNSAIPAILGCFENKIVVSPTVAIEGWLGELIRLNVTPVRDNNGNLSESSFSWSFRVGQPQLNNTSYMASINPSSSSFVNKDGTTSLPGISSVSTQMPEDAVGTINANISTNQTTVDTVLVYFNVSGTATYGVDYTVSGTHTFDGKEGSVYILKGGSLTTLRIDPIADTLVEPNETIILSILSGGDYNIGSSNKVTYNILNDDADDCLNGGNVFVLNNNNPGNTAIEPSTYHKSLLETIGTVESPSNVTLKGAKSVTLKPGFQIKAGSIFTAKIEGCPQSTAAYSVSSTETKNQTSNNVLVASSNEEITTSVAEPTSTVKFEPNIFAAVNDKKVFFEFKLDKDENVTLVLLNDYAGEKLRIIDGENYKSGVYNVEIETSTLKEGNYYLKLTTRDKKIYQKITIK
jgi:hypothetical protein